MGEEYREDYGRLEERISANTHQGEDLTRRLETASEVLVSHGTRLSLLEARDTAKPTQQMDEMSKKIDDLDGRVHDLEVLTSRGSDRWSGFVKFMLHLAGVIAGAYVLSQLHFNH